MEEAQIVVLDVDLAHLSESMSLELNKLGGQLNENEIENVTIFPVPYEFRQSKKNLFDPSVVSIGPLHHGKESLKAMEDQKWRFLRDFLSRGNHISLDLCLSEIKKLEEKTRRCYSERVDFDSNDFIEMMLLDGCFVLEYFLKRYQRRLNSIGHYVFILSDLLLIENQIPFFIVEKLYEIGLKPEDRMDFRNYLVNVFARAVLDDSIFPNPTDDSIFPNPPDEIHHFVHLCYHYSMPNYSFKSVFSLLISLFCPVPIWKIIKYFVLEFFLWVLTRIFPKSNSQSLSYPKLTWKSLMVIPCATQLKNAGIGFTPKSGLCHMLEISFVLGVLEIPRLTITNESKTLLANLVAFEQYKFDKMTAKLSSFALLLDSLLKTPEDVMILQQCGIVNNCLDSDEELINFFNQICKGMVVEKSHFLAKLFAEVNNYCKSSLRKRQATWNRHKKQFIKDYFSSPWTTISLVGAVLVVLLTILQTFFAIYAYFVPRS